MTKVCLIKNDTISTELLYFSIDSMGKYIMEKDFVCDIEVNKDDYLIDSVKLLEAENVENFIGDTVTVYFDTQYTYKMIFFTSKNKLESNHIASIFHPEGLVVRGYVVLLKYSIDKELIDCPKEDVIKLLIKRRDHDGLHFKDGKFKTVTIDNRWNIISSDMKLSNKIKKIINVYNYFVILISDKPCDMFDDNEKYIFSLLDHNKKVIVDFSETEFNLLSLNRDKHYDKFDDIFSPFIELNSV